MKGKKDDMLKQLKNLDEMNDKDIDYSDSPDLSEVDFSKFELVKHKKQVVTMRLDSDLLEFFKSMGKGYQTKINEILREYKRQHKH
jgi:uncharacterized protein (DUF4415 family)